ncbi:MAG: hypothetical protein ACE5JN_14640 [Candidatus Methylomirabilia bacterium]
MLPNGLIKRLRAVVRNSGGERGVVLVTSLLVMLLLMPLGALFLTISLTEAMIASNQAGAAQGFSISEAGIEHARKELITANIDAILASTPPLINFTSGGQSVGFAGGTYSVTVGNNATAIGSIPADPGGANSDTDNILILTATGALGTAASSIEAIVQVPLVTPPGAPGAVTTNGPTQTNGTITIDGRNHDMNGNAIIAGSGTYGVFTADTYTQSGNSRVGGTDTDGDDYAPGRPADPSVVEENYSGSMAATPDEVMGGAGNGYAEGTLESIAQSGVNGSQYVTDPATLAYPLSGATYVELPCGGEWAPANIEGSGILIVHNACGNAVIQDLDSGTFRGLLIADDIVHVHADIIGAVAVLTTAPSSGNVIGNGTGRILYSEQALARAIATALNVSYRILAWRQL